jgi:hypothetical protein
MTIITYRHRPKPKRSAKAVAAAATGPSVVSAKKPAKWLRTLSEAKDDPEADARVAAFFDRMIKPLA